MGIKNMMDNTSPATTRSSRRVNVDTTKLAPISEAPNGDADRAPRPSANNDEEEEESWENQMGRRSTLLKAKAKSESINPLGLAVVALVLGCILGCPYEALELFRSWHGSNCICSFLFHDAARRPWHLLD